MHKHKIIFLGGQLLINNTKEHFTFTGSKEYFKDNPAVLRYIQNKKLAKQCHQVSHDLINLLPSGKLIIVLIPNEFDSHYYHSVVQDEHGMIIDLANGIVCTKDTFYKFYDDLKV